MHDLTRIFLNLSWFSRGKKHLTYIKYKDKSKKYINMCHNILEWRKQSTESTEVFVTHCNIYWIQYKILDVTNHHWLILIYLPSIYNSIFSFYEIHIDIFIPERKKTCSIFVVFSFCTIFSCNALRLWFRIIYSIQIYEIWNRW